MLEPALSILGWPTAHSNPCAQSASCDGSTLFEEVPVQPVPFLSQLLWCSAHLYHLSCMVVIRSNCSCMVDCELALRAAATSMRLITIWPAWRVNTLAIYWACLSLSIPPGAKDRPGQQCAAVAMAVICIWLIREHDLTCLNFNECWHLAENGNPPEISQFSVFPFKFICIILLLAALQHMGIPSVLCHEWLAGSVRQRERMHNFPLPWNYHPHVR